MTIRIVSADRPDANEEELAWVAGIRRALSERQQIKFDRGDFVECNSCDAKPGSPTLCGSCLANRHIISLHRAALRESAARIAALESALREACAVADEWLVNIDRSPWADVGPAQDRVAALRKIAGEP